MLNRVYLKLMFRESIGDKTLHKVAKHDSDKSHHPHCIETSSL